MVQGPNYCYFCNWEAPDTAHTPATLTGYRMYRDSVLFLSTTHTGVDTAGGYLAGFYVTAVYADPAGESEPSNVVVIGDLPIATGEAAAAPDIGIGFDLARRVLIIAGAEYARTLRVYNLQGVQVLSTKVVSMYPSVEGWTPGMYVVMVQDKRGSIWSKMVVLGL